MHPVASVGVYVDIVIVIQSTNSDWKLKVQSSIHGPAAPEYYREVKSLELLYLRMQVIRSDQCREIYISFQCFKIILKTGLCRTSKSRLQPYVW